MKTIKKNVYYCEYCKKKKGLSKGAMLKHEKHCTANPNRECRICGRKEGLKELIERFKQTYTTTSVDNYDELLQNNFEERKIIWKEKEITLQDVKDSVDDCPNCTLAIIRQAFPQQIIEYPNYKEELKASNAQSYRDYERY
jgi:hypothetical protein